MIENKDEGKNEIDEYLGIKDEYESTDKNQTIRPFAEESKSSDEPDEE